MMNGVSGMGIGWIFGFLILAIVIGLIIRGINTPQRYARLEFDENDALNILKKRYAKGEISDAEFEHMKSELENDLEAGSK